MPRKFPQAKAVAISIIQKCEIFHERDDEESTDGVQNSKHICVDLGKCKIPPTSKLGDFQSTVSSEGTSVAKESNHAMYVATFPHRKLEEALGKTAFECESAAEPKDRYKIVLISMYFFGIACSIPWKFLTQASEYWMYKFRDVNDASALNGTESKTELQVEFSSYLAIACEVPYVTFLFINSLLASRFLPDKRILYSLIMMAALFTLTAAMVEVNTDYRQQLFFAVTIATVVVITALCGFVRGSSTGIAASLPKAYMGHNVCGMAVSGILASVTQIICLLGDASSTTSACIYFVFATVAILVTYGFFLSAKKSEFYKFYMSKQASTNAGCGKVVITANTNMAILKKVWVYAFSVMVIFWVTASVMPAVVVLISSTSTAKTEWTTRFFIPVACFLVFNVSELAGVLVSYKLEIPPSWKYLTMGLCVLRAVFIPLLMLCNAIPRSHLPVIFDSDISFIIIIIFFGFTSGYFCSVVSTQAPKEVDVEYQEIAGSFMAFFLTFGYFLGSVTSFGTINLL